MNVIEYTEELLLLPALRVKDRHGASKALAERLEMCGCIADADPFLWEIRWSNRVLHATAGTGVTFASARGPFVRMPRFAVGRSEQGISFGHGPEASARLIFLVATSGSPPSIYLELMSGLAKLMSDQESRENLLRSQTPQEMYAVLAAQNRSNAAFLSHLDLSLGKSSH